MIVVVVAIGSGTRAERTGFYRSRERTTALFKFNCQMAAFGQILARNERLIEQRVAGNG